MTSNVAVSFLRHPLTGGKSVWMLLLCFALLSDSFLSAQQKSTPVATLTSGDATLFGRSPSLPAKLQKLKWRVYKQNETVAADRLFVGFPGGTIRSKNQAVELLFATDINDKTPYPIFEAAIIPHQDKAVDLSFTLQRGRVVLTNAKKAGSVTVKARFRNEVWQIILDKPGTRISLETFGRWPPGSRFTPNPKTKKGPIQQTIALVLKGKVTLKTATNSFTMNAPPGPAIYSWVSSHGRDRAPQSLKSLPAWSNPDFDSKEVKANIARLKKVRKVFLREKTVPAAIRSLLNSKDKEIRRNAPIAAGALDALGELSDVLHQSNDVELWQTSVASLRHWLGRRPGLDQYLFRVMIDLENEDKMPKAHAQTLITLLHGFSEEDQKQPELYEALIQFLKHERQGIRGLAAWHLHHLAPDQKIPFRPNAKEKERENIYQAWRKAIPVGQLPQGNESKK